MLWCESVAPLGMPVVPLVYWMLIGSSGVSSAPRALDRVDVGSRAGEASQAAEPKTITSCSAGTSGRASSTIAT